jgi:hypothetical protein
MTLGTRFERRCQKLVVFVVFGLLWVIAHYFGVPGRFLRPVKLATPFERGRQNLVVFTFCGL